MDRAEIDRRLREHAGDDAEAIIGWMRSSMLSDEDAADLLYRLDMNKQARDRADRMRVSASGEVDVD